MSSQAVGCMTVVLPESKIPEFEAYFDEENEFAFKNTEIWLLEQIRTIDKTRLTEYVCRVNRKTMGKINRAIKVSLGIINLS